MLIVEVKLHSAITGKKMTLASMVIANDGTERDPKKGSYWGRAYRKGHDYYKGPEHRIIRRGEVKGYPRLSQHVWNLVALMLQNMGYGQPAKGKKDEDRTG